MLILCIEAGAGSNAHDRQNGSAGLVIPRKRSSRIWSSANHPAITASSVPPPIDRLSTRPGRALMRFSGDAAISAMGLVMHRVMDCAQPGKNGLARWEGPLLTDYLPRTVREISVFARLPRWIRFLLVGVVNTAFGYLLFAAFVLAGAPRLWAVVGMTALGALFNFRSIGHLVFARNDLTLLPRFMGVYVGQCAVNAVALDKLSQAGLSPLAGQAILVPFLAAGVYVAMQTLVFREPRSAN
jgi:putative flippase GtrA